jgi:DNA-binding winged helix-turn-helix (wHTH) protein
MHAQVRFGAFTLDRQKRLLLKDHVPVALGPKVVDTLAILVENAGQLVTKDELLEQIWPDGFALDGSLAQNIYRLRRVLADGGLSGAIETMPCRGYRFIADVDAVEGNGDLVMVWLRRLG